MAGGHIAMTTRDMSVVITVIINVISICRWILG